MNELIDIKDTFYKQLDQYLTSCGFSKNDNQWMRISYERTPGQRMFINGQVMEQPGTTIDINIIITNVGTISTGDDDKLDGIEMYQINILRKHNDEEVVNIDLGADYDDFEYIKSNINQIL